MNFQRNFQRLLILFANVVFAILIIRNNAEPSAVHTDYDTEDTEDYESENVHQNTIYISDVSDQDRFQRPESRGRLLEKFERPYVMMGHHDISLFTNLSYPVIKPKLRIWTANFKIGPVFAMKRMLMNKGITLLDDSLSSFCKMTNSCSSHWDKFKDSLWDTWPLIAKNYEKYLSSNSDFLTSDMALCIYPLRLCEIYLKFKKKLILVVDDRYEEGISTKAMWTEWNRKLEKIRENRDIVVASNYYDSEYLKYFTEIDLTVIPYLCDYISESYVAHDARKNYLLMPVSKPGMARWFSQSYENFTKGFNLTTSLEYAPDVLLNFTHKDLLKYKGLIIIPHQTAYIALKELSMLNIPLFVPSVTLLKGWQQQYDVISYKSVTKKKLHNNGQPKTTLLMDSRSGLPNPNDDKDLWAIEFWIQHADFYQWPGVFTFSSVRHLAKMLDFMTERELASASKRLADYNTREIERVKSMWQNLLFRNKT